MSTTVSENIYLLNTVLDIYVSIEIWCVCTYLNETV